MNSRGFDFHVAKDTAGKIPRGKYYHEETIWSKSGLKWVKRGVLQNLTLMQVVYILVHLKLPKLRRRISNFNFIYTTYAQWFDLVGPCLEATLWYFLNHPLD